jgi:hypothetical protein
MAQPFADLGNARALVRARSVRRTFEAGIDQLEIEYGDRNGGLPAGDRQKHEQDKRKCSQQGAHSGSRSDTLGKRFRSLGNIVLDLNKEWRSHPRK